MVMCLLTLCARFMRTGGGQKSHQVRPQLGGELGGQRRRAARQHFMGGKQDNQQQHRQLHQRHHRHGQHALHSTYVWQVRPPVRTASSTTIIIIRVDKNYTFFHIEIYWKHKEVQKYLLVATWAHKKLSPGF